MKNQFYLVFMCVVVAGCVLLLATHRVLAQQSVDEPQSEIGKSERLVEQIGPAPDDIRASPSSEQGSGLDGDSELQNTEKEKTKPVRFGIVIPRGSTKTAASYQPFLAFLGTETGQVFDTRVFRTTRGLIDAFVEKRVDYARLSAGGFATGWVMCRCIKPLVVPISDDGTHGYFSILISLAGSKISNLRDLADKRVALVFEGSTAGDLLPRHALIHSGLDTKTEFPDIQMFKSAREAFKALKKNKVDAVASWSSLTGDSEEGYSRGGLQKLVSIGMFSMADMRVFWQSRRIPHGPHSISTSMDKAIANSIAAALTLLPQKNPDAFEALDPFYDGGFRKISQAEYTPLIELVDQ